MRAAAVVWGGGKQSGVQTPKKRSLYNDFFIPEA